MIFYILLTFLAIRSAILLQKGQLVNTLGVNLADPDYDSGAESAPYMITRPSSEGGLDDGNGDNYTDKLFRYDDVVKGITGSGESQTYTLGAYVRHVHVHQVYSDSSTGSSRSFILNINAGLPTRRGSRLKLTIYSYRENQSGSTVQNGTTIEINGTNVLGTITGVNNNDVFELHAGTEMILTNHGWQHLSRYQDLFNE